MPEKKELKLKKGCLIQGNEPLYEGYTVEGSCIIANVSIEKIEDVFFHFLVLHDEKVFFILELPASSDDEKEVHPGVVEKLHKDVYYIDGCSAEEAIAILNRAGEILYNDGLSSFGFGGHESSDEIMFGKYNVCQIYTENPGRFKDFFERHSIERTDNLITGWDILSSDNPGISTRYEKNGKTVFDLPEMFKDWGIYLAEQREE